MCLCNYSTMWPYKENQITVYKFLQKRNGKLFSYIMNYEWKLGENIIKDYDKIYNYNSFGIEKGFHAYKSKLYCLKRIDMELDVFKYYDVDLVIKEFIGKREHFIGHNANEIAFTHLTMLD